jgi:uncharacterized caspase-like protein
MRRLVGYAVALVTMAVWAAMAQAQPKAAPAAAPPKVALVIGNATYKDNPLRNPANDARAMAAVLKQLGFQVIARENATKQQMERAVAEFGTALKPGAVALFYYAGHGLQVNGRNFLVPVDAEIPGEHAVRLETLDVDLVLDQLAARGSDVNLVILDACRNNPFERRWRSSGGGGLAQINAPKGTLIAYATAPGSVAADGTGENGLYTAQLVQAIKTPGLPIEEVFKKVRVEVARETADLQTPWEASSLTGTFYFTGPVTVIVNPPAAGAAPAKPAVFRPTDLAVVRSAAAEREMRLPEQLAIVPPATGASREATLLIGAWGGDDRWGGNGRKVMVVIEDIKPSGLVRGVLSEGGPGPGSWNQNAKGGWLRFEGMLRGNAVEFTTPQNFLYRFELSADGGHVAGSTQSPADHKPKPFTSRIDLARIGAKP